MKVRLLLSYPIRFAVALVLLLAGATVSIFAADTSNFTQTINAGTLAVDITNSSYVTVGSPTVAMNAATFSFGCQTVTGTFGTASEQIYITNPDAADNGWTVSVAASATTAVWDSAGTDFDFNDPTTSGCADGGDADSLAGQLTINPAAGSVTAAQCDSCNTTGVTLGTSSAFNQGTTDSITVATGASESSDIGDWYIRGVSLSQTIPAEQPAAADYDINMVLSIVAS